jgi:hypothetical protein
VLALAACVLAACGADEEEGEPIPAGLAGQLQAQLNSIQGRFEFPGGAACGDIAGGDDPNTTAVRNLIGALPQNVDPDVRDALQQSFDRLFELVEQECSEEPPETETETTPPETETTETVPTETVPTETVPTETIPTETLPTEPLPPGQGGEPPGQGGENPGQGDGGGAGPDEDDG